MDAHEMREMAAKVADDAREEWKRLIRGCPASVPDKGRWANECSERSDTANDIATAIRALPIDESPIPPPPQEIENEHR